MSDVFDKDEITWSKLERELRRLFKRVIDNPNCLSAMVDFVLSQSSKNIYSHYTDISIKELDKFDKMLSDLKEELEAIAAFEEGRYVLFAVEMYSFQHRQKVYRTFQLPLTIDFIYG